MTITPVDKIVSANPFNNQPLDASTLELAVDRVEELRKLERALSDATKGIRQSYAILGEDGSGKTSLLNLVQGRAEVRSKLLVIRLEVTSESDELRFFKGLVQAIIGELEKITGSLGPFVGGDIKGMKKRLEGIIKEESVRNEVSVSIPLLFGFLGFGGKISAQDKETRQRFEDVTEILPSLEKVVKFVLSKRFSTVLVLIDEAGYIASATTKSLLQRMRLLFQNAPFMLIVAGNPLLLDELIQVEPTFANLIPPNLRIRLSSLTETNVREVIETRLAKVRVSGKNLDPFTIEAADEVFRQSRGNLRDIVLILHEALEIALNENKAPIDPEIILRASKVVLAGKGRDMFSRLKEYQREIVVSIFRSDEDYVARLARKLKKKSPTLIEQIKSMRELGYLEVSREVGNITYYRLSKPLAEYLSH